jgi:hypothetical protein
MAHRSFTYSFLVATTLQLGETVADEPSFDPELVDVELTAPQRDQLLAAPQKFLSQAPSGPLARAMSDGRVERVRADRAANWESGVVQGWIYFAEVDGIRPIVLCVSQAGPAIEWMHCQEQTARKDSPCNLATRSNGTPPVIRPTERSIPFEAYVARTGSTPISSTEVGRIGSARAELVITTLVVDGRCEDPVQQRRGIRIALIDDTTAQNLYIEQKDIGSILHAVENLEAELDAGQSPVYEQEPNSLVDPDQISSCRGRGEFRFGDPPFGQFTVDYCAAAAWTGLSILVFAAEHRFSFPDYRPNDLARILGQALTAL